MSQSEKRLFPIDVTSHPKKNQRAHVKSHESAKKSFSLNIRLSHMTIFFNYCILRQWRCSWTDGLWICLCSNQQSNLWQIAMDSNIDWLWIDCLPNFSKACIGLSFYSIPARNDVAIGSVFGAWCARCFCVFVMRLWVCESVCARVQICVYAWDRARECVSMSECVCVCVWKRERDHVCRVASLIMCVCVCVCVWERERERETMYVALLV